MKTFELQTDLEPKRGPWEINQSNYELGTRTFLFPRHPDVHCLKGFIEYICFCYQHHYAAVMSPTDIMYMVQCELATAVKKAPDQFAALFTTTPGTKQEIVTLTGNPEEIDVFAVVDKLRERVPTNVDLFLPEFSTTGVNSVLATHVAFCDMVSPYYSYSTMMCGIPRIEISGTEEDWNKLARTLYSLSELFTGDLKKYIGRVWSRVTGIIGECKHGYGRMFQQMVQMKKCGSGSQYDVTGWILEFMNTPDRPPIMLQNVHQHISKMEYKNLETQRTFEMYAGIFYCELKDGTAIPAYNANRVETTDGMDKKPKKKEFIIHSTPIVSKVQKLNLPEGFKFEIGQDIQSYHSPEAEAELKRILGGDEK